MYLEKLLHRFITSYGDGFPGLEHSPEEFGSGIIVSIKILKYIIDIILHGKTLYELCGLSMYLFGAFINSCTSFLVHRYYHGEKNKKQAESNQPPMTDNDQLEYLIVEPNTIPPSAPLQQYNTGIYPQLDAKHVTSYSD